MITRLYLPGRIPSKKNSKVFNVKMKRLFSSSAHREWEASMLKLMLLERLVEPIQGACSIVMRFNFPDMRRTDLSNKAESVMDLLVKAGILEDDSWQKVPTLTLLGGYDKLKPGCEIEITRSE